ncbi:hypothetical protein QN358_13215, partial [Subtercola sp. RTI3]|nr:hypothetical protein [Subtercola sp. RTI3]
PPTHPFLVESIGDGRGMGEERAGQPSDEVYSALFAWLKDRFIDFEPGPDIRTYADAIAAGEFSSGENDS